jgi:beta-phosphoglucomutase family hydrolase
MFLCRLLHSNQWLLSQTFHQEQRKILMQPGERAIIFDMDGTIIDSEPVHLKAYQAVLNGFGVSYTEKENREFLGRTDAIVSQALIARYKLDLSVPGLIEIKERKLKELLSQSATVRDGVLAVLRQASASHVPLAVASSATLATIEFVVDALAIRHYFQTVASGDEVEHGKPAPDVFLLAAERLHVKPAACLVIEDTANGIKAAKAAGMKCIAVPCDATKHEDHSQADLVLPSLSQFDVNQWLKAGTL